MTRPNGHAQDTGASTSVALSTASQIAAATQFPPEKVKALVAELEVPFDPAQIEWRVMNSTKNGQPMRGQVVPYADQRAYTLYRPTQCTLYAGRVDAQVHDSNERTFRTKPGL